MFGRKKKKKSDEDADDPLAGVEIRRMVRADYLDVALIDAYPLSRLTEAAVGALVREKSCGALVAAKGEVVTAYALYDLLPTTLYLRRCVVAPEYRRRGVFGMISRHLKSRLGGRRTNLACSVDERNLPAQLALRSQGWRCTSTSEDKYFFQAELPFGEGIGE